MAIINYLIYCLKKHIYRFSKKNWQSSSGQSLIEYLIIVALIAITTIGMVKAVGTNISVHFANIAKALAGDESKEIAPVKVQADQVQTRDLHDYMKGAASGPRK